jgi:hypothetical protein
MDEQIEMKNDDSDLEEDDNVVKSRNDAMRSIKRLNKGARNLTDSLQPEWHIKDEGSASKDDKYKFQKIEKQKQCEDGKTRYKIVFEYATNITGDKNYNYYTGRESQTNEVVDKKIKVGNLVRYIGDGEERDKVAIVSKIIYGTDTNEGSSSYYEKAIASGVSMSLDDVKKLNKKTKYTLKFLHKRNLGDKAFITVKSKLKKEKFYNKNRCFRLNLQEGETTVSKMGKEIKTWISDEVQKLFGVNSKMKKYFSPEFIYKGKIVKHNKKNDTYKVELTDGSHPFCRLDNIPKKGIRLVEKNEKNKEKREKKLEKKRDENEIMDERVKEEYLDKGDKVKINTGNPQPNIRYYIIRSSYKTINVVKEGDSDIFLIKIKIFLDLGRETVGKQDDSKIKSWWNKLTDTTANSPATMNCKKKKNVVAEIVSGWFGYGGGKRRKKTRKKRAGVSMCGKDEVFWPDIHFNELESILNKLEKATTGTALESFVKNLPSIRRGERGSSDRSKCDGCKKLIDKLVKNTMPPNKILPIKDTDILWLRRFTSVHKGGIACTIMGGKRCKKTRKKRIKKTKKKKKRKNIRSRKIKRRTRKH